MADDGNQPSRDATRTPAAPKVRWDDSKMTSSYANVCNVSSTREEVVLFFGISHPSQTGEPEVAVNLSDRIILSPYAAKRLVTLLNSVVDQYEQRFGKLGPEPTPRPAAAKAPAAN